VTAVTPGARPADLVPGDPEDVERVAARLVRVATSAADAADRLGTLDADVWTGETAALFHAAVGDVPARLTRAAAAFGTAAQALQAYGRALRDGQAVAAAAVRMVEQATPESLSADQQTAQALVARAAEEVAAAGALAAQRLAAAAADAPTDAPAGAELTLRVGAEHELTDPDHFVSPPHEWGDSIQDMRYTSAHQVAFAGSLGGDGSVTGDPGWPGWAASAADRSVGVVEAGTVAAAGAAVAAPLIGRRRDRTALGLVGLDEAELRRRRDEFGGPRHRESVLVPARAARLPDGEAWRTRLAPTTRPPGTVAHWTASTVDPLPREGVRGDRTGSVDRDVRGAVLRTGRPAHEAS
jgi:hypothetical protein